MILDTPADRLKRIQRAIDREERKSFIRAVPVTDTRADRRQMSFGLPKELYTRFESLAQAAGVTRSELARKLVTQYVETTDVRA